jgi:hypothetical protein
MMTPDERAALELELVEERAARIPQLAAGAVSAADPDEAYDVARNVAGALQALIVYLEAAS